MNKSERFNKWKTKNPDYFRDYHKKWSKANPGRVLLNCSRQNARKKNQDHTITLEDIVIPDKCPVFGIPFTSGMHVASIDRIDNSKGYVPGNVQVINKRANMMKYDASIDELIMFAHWVINTYGSKQ